MTFKNLERNILKTNWVRFARGGSALLHAFFAFAKHKNRLNLMYAAWQVVRSQGLRGFTQAFAEFAFTSITYEHWLELHGTLSEADIHAIQRNISALQERPLFSIFINVENTHKEWLLSTINSVSNQLYGHWEIWLFGKDATTWYANSVIRKKITQDKYIKVISTQSDTETGITWDNVVNAACGKFVAILDAGDEITAHALYVVAATLCEKPHLDLIYSDSDNITETGRRFDPHFKPDWNPDLMRGQNVVGNLCFYRAEILRSLDGFNSDIDNDAWGLALQIGHSIPSTLIHHIPHILFHKRIAPSAEPKTGKEHNLLTATAKMLNKQLEQSGYSGHISITKDKVIRTHYSIPSPAPVVSIIIPTRNGLSLLRRCIESIKEKTLYPYYEILVINNQSDDAETLSYLHQIEHSDVARIFDYDYDFNYSAINNFASKMAVGNVLCLMNNDVEIITTDWLDEMVSHAMRPEIGAVGAMLYYTNDTIQHAGVLVGMGGCAGHLYAGAPRKSCGYMMRTKLVQNLSAVTAACLVVRKSVYEEVYGLDEINLPVAFNDVDFCLRIQERGYRNLWTPFAELYHHESATRGAEDTPEKKRRFNNEVAYMRWRWEKQIANDPSHNPNLTLRDKWPTLAPIPRLKKPWM